MPDFSRFSDRSLKMPHGADFGPHFPMLYELTPSRTRLSSPRPLHRHLAAFALTQGASEVAAAGQQTLFNNAWTMSSSPKCLRSNDRLKLNRGEPNLLMQDNNGPYPYRDLCAVRTEATCWLIALELLYCPRPRLRNAPTSRSRFDLRRSAIPIGGYPIGLST